MKKKITIFLLCLLLLFSSACSISHTSEADVDVAATTWPVYCFTSAICDGTPVQVDRVITESVSCLHNYTLSVQQMKILDRAALIVCSGADLEDFMQDAIGSTKPRIDASEGVALLTCEAHEDNHMHGHDDPHIWLSPENAKIMVQNICDGLCEIYPQSKEDFQRNTQHYLEQLDALQAYGEETLQSLSCRNLITLHDGFTYFADAFNLSILASVEEESGAEASAEDLRTISKLVEEYQIPAVFVERNGSDAAAGVIAQETGCQIYTLTMIMDETDYLQAMYENIATVKEALQ